MATDPPFYCICSIMINISSKIIFFAYVPSLNTHRPMAIVSELACIEVFSSFVFKLMNF